MLAALSLPGSVAVGLAVACVAAVVLIRHSGDLCLCVGAWRTGGRPASDQQHLVTCLDFVLRVCSLPRWDSCNLL